MTTPVRISNLPAGAAVSDTDLFVGVQSGTTVKLTGLQIKNYAAGGGGGGGTTTYAVTFTNTGGAAAGTTFDGSAARTIDYSTLGAAKADGTGASGTWGIGITGNAGTATALQTARTINGVSFDGTSNITVTDATKLPLSGGTMTGAITFDAGQTWPTFNQNTTGTASNVTGTVAVANGGTGLTSTPSNGQLLIGNGTNFSLATLTAGSNVTITNASGAITIASTGSGGGGGGTNLDGGLPDSSYAAIDPIDGGTP